MCTQHLEQEDTAHMHRLERVVKLCTESGVNGAMDVYRAAGVGQWMCTYQEHRIRPCMWAQVSGASGRQWTNAQTWHVYMHSWGLLQG